MIDSLRPIPSLKIKDSSPLMEIIKKLKSLFSKENRLSKAYCQCGHETLQDDLSKFYEAGTYTNIICSNCGTQTSWDLCAPVPIFLTSIPSPLLTHKEL